MEELNETQQSNQKGGSKATKSVYKTANRGDVSFEYEWYNERKDAYERRFIVFKNHTYITDNKDDIKFLESIREAEKHLPVSRKKVLTQDEFDEYVTPEKVWIPYKDMVLHISEVRQGLEIAEENGWTPKQVEKKIIEKSAIKVQQGSTRTAAGTGGL